MGPGFELRGGARGFESSFEPGIEDFDGGFRRGGHAGDGQDVGVVDGTAIEGLAGIEAGSGEHAWEFVGDHGDADAGSAGEKSASVGGGGADAAADFGGDGVVGVGADVFDFDVEGLEVGDESVFERAAEGVGSGDDFESVTFAVFRHGQQRMSSSHCATKITLFDRKSN